MRENCVLRSAWLPILEIPILPPLFDNGIKLFERRQPLPWKVPVCPDPSGQTGHCPMAVTVASSPASTTYEISGYSSEEPNFPHALAASCHLGNRLPPRPATATACNGFVSQNPRASHPVTHGVASREAATALTGGACPLLQRVAVQAETNTGSDAFRTERFRGSQTQQWRGSLMLPRHRCRIACAHALLIVHGF